MPTITKADWINSALIVRDCLITLAVLTYLAGFYLGRLIHTANDRIAASWPTRPVSTPPPTVAPIAAPITVHPVVATLAPSDRVARVHRLRHQLNWSQQQIADYLGCSRTTVRRALMA